LIRVAGTLGPPIEISALVECSYLKGQKDRLLYARVKSSPSDVWSGEVEWQRDGFNFNLSDDWRLSEENCARLERRVAISKLDSKQISSAQNGLQFHIEFNLPCADPKAWRFFVPAKLYGSVASDMPRCNTWSDDRLPFPLVLAYLGESRLGLCMSRVKLASSAEAPIRKKKELSFLQKTDLGSLGFSLNADSISLHVYWPYYEGERSIALDSSGSSPSAFYPLNDSELVLSLSYEIMTLTAETFADAVMTAFKHAYALADSTPPSLPFSLRDSVEYRISSLKETYREWGSDGAAFICSFNPEAGYESPATGFGTSFNIVDLGESQNILEYGFTGRQLNSAYVLAKLYGGEWITKGRRAIEFFVRHCTADSGWLYSIYHIGKGRPLYTVGDPEGRVMHYLAVSPEPANYLRMMVEAAFDLLLNYRLYRELDLTYDHWLAVCCRLGDFLVEHQNADGSWYRAYSPDGRPIKANRWFGEAEAAAKSSTAIPISYLVALAGEMPHGKKYLESARRAGLYSLQHSVAIDHYQGGTLDNPNVVDKEAALYATQALLALYDAFKEPVFLDGAHRAAKLAITWNYIWNVPHIRGTRLDRAGLESTGWGGINSIWAGGVGDIYTLFFLSDLLRLSRLTHEPFFSAVSDLVANGTQQLLSHPGDLMGFADVGMQPEGIGLCNQGVDEGLIAKGDIWGSTGWIYSAGTFGLLGYLMGKEG